MYLCIARDQDPDKVPQHFLQQRLKKIKLKLEPAPEPGQNGMATQLCSWPWGKKNIFALCIYSIPITNVKIMFVKILQFFRPSKFCRSY